MQHKYTTYSGGYSTRKGSVILHRLGVTLTFESGIEEAVARVLGCSHHVQRLERGETITYHLPTGETRQYTPDYVVSLMDGRTLTLEVKPAALLAGVLHNEPEVWQTRAAYLHAQGRPLYVVTDVDVPRTLVAQAVVIGPYHGVPAHPALRETVQYLLAERGLKPLNELRAALQQRHPEVREHIDGTLYGLLARHELHADPLVALSEARIGLPDAGLAPPPTVGRPLAEALREQPMEKVPLPVERVSPREQAFMATPRGQRYLKLFSLYSDPTLPLTAERVAALTAETEVSERSLRRFRETLREAGAPGITFADLVPVLTSAGGRPRRQLDLAVQGIMERLIHEYYLRPLGHPGRARNITDLHLMVRKACQADDLPPPAYNTVKAHVQRIVARDPLAATRLREGREAVQMLEPRQGKFTVTHYGELIGIDCTPADVFTIEAGLQMKLHRSGRGKAQRAADAMRANIITVQDIATSQVLRSVVVQGPISAQRILHVLREVFLGDVGALLEAGMSVPPQARGLPRAVRIDGGTEFVNRAVAGVLAYLGIETISRNKGTRHHGGPEERAIGTLTWLHHIMPGTTTNNITNRGEYDAQRGAVLSMTDLNRYHQRSLERYNGLCREYQALTRQEHAQHLLDAGLSCWRPLTEAQAHYVRNRMHPAEARRCSRQGVGMFGLWYTSPALDPLIVRQERVVVHYDPDDICAVRVVHPRTGELIRAEARLPEGLLSSALPLSAWEAVKTQMRQAQTAARDRQPTPQQILADVMAERAEERASANAKKGKGKATPAPALLDLAVGAETGRNDVAPAPITFESFPVQSRGR